MELEVVDEYVNVIQEILNFPKERIIEREFNKGNYRYFYDFGDSISLKLCGPMNKLGIPTNSLEMKGEGCREFERVNGKDKWYEFLLVMLGQLNGICTRIDLPIDDFEGNEIAFEYLKDKLDRKMYTSSFKKEYTIHGNNVDGFSLTFGQRKKDNSTTKQLCIYEKKKEQESKGNVVLEDYWVRYEMRFMHERAHIVATAIIDVYMDGVINFPTKRTVPKSDEGFVILVSSLLYGMLDIKVESSYDSSNIGKADTDPKWKAFVGDVEKAVVPAPTAKEASWNRFYKYVNQTNPIFNVCLFIKAGKNLEQYNKFQLQMLREALEIVKGDKKKLNRVNIYLPEMGKKTIDLADIEQICKKLDYKILEEELPF